MPVKRIKVDVFDDEGNKITISFEGWVTRKKVLQLLDLVEVLGGIPNAEPEKPSDLTKFDKIWQTVERKFPVGWFSSNEIMIAFEDIFNEPISLSTVSTYLSRLTSRGLLTKKGSSLKRHYKLIKNFWIQNK